MTSSIEERVKRASEPAAAVPSVMAGMIRWAAVPMPEVGSQRSPSEKARISRMPRKKFGMLKPKTANAMTKRSMVLLRLSAATMPSGTPISRLTASAVRPSSSVAGMASARTSVTGRSSVSE